MGETAEWSRAQKTQDKEREIKNPPPRRRCYDCIVCSGTCHYAKNHSPFTTYQQVGKIVQHRNPPTYVAGIGSVILKVPSSPDKGAKTISISLNNVLHIPDALYNRFNLPLGLSGYTSRREYRPGQLYCGFEDKELPIWYAKGYCGLHRQILAENLQRESYLSPRGYYNT